MRVRIQGLAAAVMAAAALLSGCSSQAPGPGTQNSQAAAQNPNLDLGSSLGGARAPDFRLTSQFGQPMSLSQFRGKAVLLSFDDSECTTVCPLTTESMVLAKELLGKAGENVQLLGVDANPDATARSDVMSYSRAHGMVNQWDFLTGTPAQLRKVWSDYHIAVQIDAGQIDHTPALFVIDPAGTLRKVYLTQMAYDSVGQSAQVLAEELSSLLPSRPALASRQSLAAITALAPTARVTLDSAMGGPAVSLGPGQPRLVVFFTTWTPGLKGELKALNSYAADHRLPGVTAVDETSVEPSAAAARTALAAEGPLSYPVGLDTTGRVADGYQVQDQPWLALVNAHGRITWSHDGWLPLPRLEKAARARS